jgi:ribonucleotide reductase alpha subunit
VAVCNHASISLPAYFDKQTLDVDWDKLEEVTRFIVGNLDNVIDKN